MPPTPADLGKGTRISVDSEDVRRALDRASRKLDTAGMREVMEDIGEEAQQAIQRNFDAEGRPRWRPWTSRYAEWRKNNADKKASGAKGEEKILTLSGRLRNSIAPDLPKRPDFYRLSGRSVRLGTNVEYAATHQFGRGSIPDRPYLQFTSADLREMVLIVEEHVSEAYNRG